MRKDGIPYNPPLPNDGRIKKSFDEMTVDELEKVVVDVCGKNHGDITVCESCMGCMEGRTLIEKLNEENKKDKLRGIRKLYGISPVEKQRIAKEIYIKALLSKDPVEYMMQNCEIDEKRAKERLRAYAKKYHYEKDKIERMKSFGEEGQKVIEKIVENIEKPVESYVIPIKERKAQTVDDLVVKLEKERIDLMGQIDKLSERLGKIESALSVIKVEVG